MVFRFIDSGSNIASRNMAIDEAIFSCHAETGFEYTLRLYTWTPPAVSIGYFQDLRKEIDLENCKSLGMNYVRRPTGGGAILHDMELTYSFTANIGGIIPMNICESYKVICGAIIIGLKSLGIDAETGNGKAEISLRQRESPVCFVESSNYDIVVRKKKIVGSAQRRVKDRLIQHGSILIDFDTEKMHSIFKTSLPFGKFHKDFANNVTSLKQELGYSIDLGKLKRAICLGFEELFKTEVKEDGLANTEIALVEKLDNLQYDSPDWNVNRKRNLVE